MSIAPFVSVVVPVFNEEYLLADCLAALQQQDYGGQYEIIVVDNACTDASPTIASRAGVRVVREPRKGYVHALRAGFAAARGEVIASTDGDTDVPPDWISRLVGGLTAQPNAVAIGGIFAFPAGPHWLQLLAGVVNRLNPELVGGNMAMWRWAYEQVGGFDPKVNLQADIELGRRLRRLGRIIIDRRLVVSTSPRRYQVAPWQAIWLHGVNYLSLTLFGRIRFYDFPDIRLRPVQRVPHRRLLLATALLTAIAVFVINAETPGGQAFGPVVARVRADQPVVALTFDDGPSAYTAQVLDILASYQVKATFFVIGMNVEKYPDLARRIVAEGHAIGNHTYSHPLLGPVESPGRFQHELERADVAIRAATGVTPRLFRPPRGLRSPWMMRLARSDGYQVVTWSVSPDDWLHPPSSVIAQRVLDRVRPGAIVLLHDGLETRASPHQENTVAALPAILEGLEARGYRFVTVPELLELAESPEASTVVLPAAATW
jgi:peptidoglycan/xylan/chitin deacetylase (PgdA/CDA1 family)/glycosyltransferase involved in cell wall biosynthesis